MDEDVIQLSSSYENLSLKSKCKKTQKEWVSQSPVPALPPASAKRKQGQLHLSSIQRWLGDDDDYCRIFNLSYRLKKVPIPDVSAQVRTYICAAGGSDQNTRSSASDEPLVKDESTSEDELDLCVPLAEASSGCALPRLGDMIISGSSTTRLNHKHNAGQDFTEFPYNFTEAIDNLLFTATGDQFGEIRQAATQDNIESATPPSASAPLQRTSKRKAEPGESFRCPYYFIHQKSSKRCYQTFDRLGTLDRHLETDKHDYKYCSRCSVACQREHSHVVGKDEEICIDPGCTNGAPQRHNQVKGCKKAQYLKFRDKWQRRFRALDAHEPYPPWDQVEIEPGDITDTAVQASKTRKMDTRPAQIFDFSLDDNTPAKRSDLARIERKIHKHIETMEKFMQKSVNPQVQRGHTQYCAPSLVERNIRPSMPDPADDMNMGTTLFSVPFPTIPESHFDPLLFELDTLQPSREQSSSTEAQSTVNMDNDLWTLVDNQNLGASKKANVSAKDSGYGSTGQA